VPGYTLANVVGNAGIQYFFMYIGGNVYRVCFFDGCMPHFFLDTNIYFFIVSKGGGASALLAALHTFT
jgi:hypothetical protein